MIRHATGNEEASHGDDGRYARTDGRYRGDPDPPSDFIFYPRLEELRGDVHRTLELTRLHGTPMCMALGGVAGSGKSSFIYQIMTEHLPIETDDLTRIPVVYVELPSPVTRRQAARAILWALDDPGPHKNLDYDEINERIITLLRNCHVRLVILDDIHHIMKKRAVDWDLSEWLKTLIKKSQVPFLIIGIPKLVTRILEANDQLSRLFQTREELQPFPFNQRDIASVVEFGQFIVFAEEALGVRLTAQTDRATLLAMLHQATAGVVGNVVWLLRFAGYEARARGSDTIECCDLSRGFAKGLVGHLRAEGKNPRPNPFPQSTQGTAGEGGNANA